ncbi:MAG: bifunctional riboflavin kinase/FAD synthetase [Saprospirales bacterium]|nr:bifunctional riboflavin kinase/FAD synthetase [Saprospirales bacterium]
MQVHHDLNELPSFRNAVVTIGSFDGVHAGHQQIIGQLIDLAKSYGGESVVVTFHPHPRQIIYPRDTSLRLLTTTDEKILLLEQLGIDHLVVVPFTVAFSQLNADEYVENFLFERFRPRCVVIGYDHRFGLNRQGDINYMRWYGEKLGFEVLEIEKQEVDNLAVSSTKVRNALDTGSVETAARFLGHYFLLSGTVVNGNKIGSELGYPTANLDIAQPQKLIPPDGVYAVWVHGQGKRYGGMLYIGNRPTLPGQKNRTIEVNLFDFNKDIYGERLRLELVAHIRGDQTFKGLEALKEQLGKDKKASEKALSQAPEYSIPFAPKKVWPKAAVVLLNYNTRNLLEQLLPAVLKSDYPNMDLYVADNGSTDGSAALVREQFPEVRLIELPENYGFAAGYNRALEQVECDYFVMLNTDVEVTPSWLSILIVEMERDPRVGAAQPKILDFKRRDQFEYAGAAGGWIDALGYPFCRGRIFGTVEKDEGQYNKIQSVFWATGAAFCIRASLFRQLGGFDPRYFAHLEEIDLCWRLKRAGYKILAVPQAAVYHIGGGTLDYQSPRKTYLNFRNNLITLWKNEPVRKLCWLIPLRLVMDGMAGMLFLVQGKKGHIFSVIQAHWHFYPKMWAIWKDRKHYEELIQKVSIHASMDTGGIYPGSVVWQYFVKGRKYFKRLKSGSR